MHSNLGVLVLDEKAAAKRVTALDFYQRTCRQEFLRTQFFVQRTRGREREVNSEKLVKADFFAAENFDCEAGLQKLVNPLN
jgi:hypothetical protein